MSNLEKNKKIKESHQKTKLKRKTQVCKVRELKIVEARLNKDQLNSLNMMFNEAKWIYNFVLSEQKNKGLDVFDINYKDYASIKRLDKSRNEIEVELKYLSSQMRQDLFQYPKNNILKLSKAKQVGLSVGSLKFKSELNSIPLKQYGSTYKIFPEFNKIKICGFKKAMTVKGMNQLVNVEWANAFLIRNSSGFYLKVTTYQTPKDKIKTNKAICLDFGIKTGITTSDGEKFNWSFLEPKQLKIQQRNLTRKEKYSKNYYKNKQKLNKQYVKLKNKKNDSTNKFVHKLLSNNDIVCVQDESIKEWKDSGKSCFGERIHHSILGGIISGLKEKPETLIIDKWVKTTKVCLNCGAEKEMPLEERRYKCPICGLNMDRDIHSAKRVLQEGLKLVPMDYRDFKLVEMTPLVESSVKQEDAHLQSA